MSAYEAILQLKSDYVFFPILCFFAKGFAMPSVDGVVFSTFYNDDDELICHVVSGFVNDFFTTQTNMKAKVTQGGTTVTLRGTMRGINPTKSGFTAVMFPPPSTAGDTGGMGGGGGGASAGGGASTGFLPNSIDVMIAGTQIASGLVDIVLDDL